MYNFSALIQLTDIASRQTPKRIRLDHRYRWQEELNCNGSFEEPSHFEIVHVCDIDKVTRILREILKMYIRLNTLTWPTSSSQRLEEWKHMFVVLPGTKGEVKLENVRNRNNAVCNIKQLDRISVKLARDIKILSSYIEHYYLILKVF